MKAIFLLIPAALVSVSIRPACAQQQTAPLATPATSGEIQKLQTLHQQFPEPQSPPPSQEAPNTPAVIPQTDLTPANNEGQEETYQPNGPTTTANNAFFRNLGTNGRTCFSCHDPQDGWGLSSDDATARFAANPNEPLFRLIDGATCPDDDVSTPASAAQAYSLLTSTGLIRISLPMQASFQFQIVNVQDTNGSDCNTNLTTGLTGPQSGFVSFYRRPIPTTNLVSESNIMWDTREPDLLHQALDATLGHAQAANTPSTAQLDQIVTFEGCNNAFNPAVCNGISQNGNQNGNSQGGNGGGNINGGVFSTESVDLLAGDLTGADGSGARGGPMTIIQALANFHPGINDPFAGNGQQNAAFQGSGQQFSPDGQQFNPAIFNIYNAWANLSGTDAQTQARQAIYRGQQVFNTVQFQITGVPGLNDVQGKPSITGTCGTCHNNPNVANHSSNLTLDIGVTAVNAPNGATSNLNIAGLPVFTVQCIAGPLNGQTFTVTDLGVAMTSGQCADIGKTKIPVIRGIAGRSPYFHNGAATQIQNLVAFYNARFNIGLTNQQESDLEVFLEAQ
jgi:cytochrome c peroxidase